MKKTKITDRTVSRHSANLVNVPFVSETWPAVTTKHTVYHC